MSTKLANVIAMILIIALGIGYWRSAVSLQDNGDMTTLGPGYFPVLLAIILIILSIISLIQSLIKKQNEKIEIPRLMLIVLTIIMIGLLIFSWSLFGYLYVHIFIFLLILILAYRLPKFNMKTFMKDSAIVLLITILTYIIFNVLLGMNL